MFIFYGYYIARFIQVKIEVRDVSELAAGSWEIWFPCEESTLLA